MLFNSYEFIVVFLPITLVVFFQLGKRHNYQLSMGWLVLTSLFFYGWSNPAYLILLLISIGCNYFIGIELSNSQENWVIKKKQILFLGIILNLSLLAYYKYTNMMILTVNNLLTTNFNFTNIILPLGISFFTFNQIAYLIDNYREQEQEFNFLKYCLFVTFFPYLTSGPIIHHKEIIPQFNNESVYRYNSQDMAIGLTIFFIGLFKKVIFADSIAAYATPIFDTASQGISLPFLEAWGGALAYSIQLYFDFSGYSDMAIGVARMFGIKFPLNFDSPYKAVNIAEFWRQWHMTLSRFLRDYLYIPLGGNRKGEFRRYYNLIVTMLLGGLWHGAGWNFVFWGGLHGVYLVIHRQWQSFRIYLGHDLKKSNWLQRAISRLITFLAVVITWVFFRSKDISSAWNMLKGMLGFNGISFPGQLADALKIKGFLANLGVSFTVSGGTEMVFTYLWIIVLLAIAWFTPNTQEWMALHSPALNENVRNSDNELGSNFWKKFRWMPNKIWSVIIGIIAGLGIVYLLRPTEFLYFQF